MTHYRTEVDVPADRYVCLQLPPHLPMGRATVIVRMHVEGDVDGRPLDNSGEPVGDVEWWEEFDNDHEPVP